MMEKEGNQIKYTECAILEREQLLQSLLDREVNI